MKPKLTISNMYRAKDRVAFFAIHQALTNFSTFDLEFHIAWDDVDYVDEWTAKIDSLDCKIVSYSREFLEQYCLDYGIDEKVVTKLKNFKVIYSVILAHYLRKHDLAEYCVRYDDDIVLRSGLDEVVYCFENQIPCLLTEPMNAGCDKALIKQVLSIYEGGYERYVAVNPTYAGINSGFLGYDLDIFSDFLDPTHFTYLLNLFNLEGIYDKDGKEIWGPERTAIDLQEQSFLSILTQIRSRKTPHILNPNEYFVCPNWGVHPIYGEIDAENEFNGWDVNMKSKIVHFIGHTGHHDVYYGKPKVYANLIDDYLQKHNIV